MQLIDKTSFILALAALLFTWVFFYLETALFFKSFFAALIAAAFVWVSYVLLRWLVLAIKGD